MFRLARTVWMLVLFWYPSNWRLFASISWTRIWRFPPRTRSYYLGSCYVPSSCFLAQHMRLNFTLICFCVCQAYAVTLLELRLFKWGKSLFQEIVQLVFFLAVEFTLFVIVCLSFFWCYCIEAPLCTTIIITVEKKFKMNPTCLTQLFNFFPLSFFIVYPNISWVGEHLHWWIHITEPYFCWR